MFAVLRIAVEYNVHVWFKCVMLSLFHVKFSFTSMFVQFSHSPSGLGCQGSPRYSVPSSGKTFEGALQAQAHDPSAE